MFCQKCGASNDEAASYCVKCGAELSQPVRSAFMAQAKAEEPVSDEEYYKAFIGPKNQAYYLQRFSRFDDEGGAGASWHWSAFFVSFYWLLYRKMWLNALIYFFLPYLIMIPFGIIGAMAGSLAGMMVGAGYLAYLVSIFILLPMYANALYYKQCKKAIAAVCSTSHNTQRQLGELSGKGGTSGIVIFIIMLMSFVAFLGIVAAVAIPAYQDYTTRARTAQAMSISRSAEAFVDSYYDQYRSFPRSFETSNFAASLPPAVQDVSIDSETGVITITMSGAAIVNGKTILLVPEPNINGQLSWTCMSEEILDRYLPRECRRAR